MRNFRYIWVLGLVATVLIVAIPVTYFAAAPAQAVQDPWAGVPTRNPEVSHASLIEGPLETGPEVTAACLECHPDAADEVAGTSHWTWLSPPVQLAGRDEPVQVGKANSLNNFCLGTQGNEVSCMRCHAGYGWDDSDFDFNNTTNVDCLVCHADPGLYQKAGAGLPAEGTDLVAAAQSVGVPTRENCGGCHFNGGGGNAVKHGDLDESLYFPEENLDVHMGQLDFLCIDCHQTEHHVIQGRSISVSLDDENQVYCTDCHASLPHEDARLNDHTNAVACQTCHVPAGATRNPTKINWDWSQAGQDLPDDPHTYLRIKGAFVYEANTIPEYYWYSGTVENRYLLGDVMDPNSVTEINPLAGDIHDPDALIWPFKVHRAMQPYDMVYNILIQPITSGEGGYWTTFDWPSALAMGAEETGLPFSGEYGFAPTAMYWPQTHLVAPASYALQCADCHGENGRMDWIALGYYGDPMVWGGRNQMAGGR